MARLVENSKEMNEIFQELNRSTDAYTLPVRGMLQFVLNGKLPTGKLYVNQDRSAVVVLHELSEYSTLNGDTVAAYAKTIEVFQQFFKAISEERLWQKQRRIVLLIYVRDDFKESIKSTLPRLHCNDLGAFILQMVPRKHDVTATLPPGYRMAPGKPEDAQAISDAWEFGVPDKVNMFRWMLETFPCMTIRDSDDKPVAWVLTYSCGGAASLYVKPEFRRWHFGRLMVAEIAQLHARLLPCPRYGGVSPKNTVSLAFSHSNKAERLEAMGCWLVFGFENANSKI